MDVEVPEEEIERRWDDRDDPEPPYTSGVLGKYARDFGSPAEGAVTNPESGPGSDL